MKKKSCYSFFIDSVSTLKGLNNLISEKIHNKDKFRIVMCDEETGGYVLRIHNKECEKLANTIFNSQYLSDKDYEIIKNSDEETNKFIQKLEDYFI